MLDDATQGDWFLRARVARRRERVTTPRREHDPCIASILYKSSGAATEKLASELPIPRQRVKRPVSSPTMNELLAPIFDTTLTLLERHGVWAVFVLMILESACIPAPSELIMLYAGALVSHGDATLLAVISAGVAGNVIGSLIAWAVGAYGGRALIERYGKWIRLNHRHLDHADRWFARYGTRAVLITRMMPIIRTFISLPAGISRMPIRRFTLYTVIGCVPWVTGLALIGVAAGPHWTRARELLHYGDYLMVLAILGCITWLFIRWRRRSAALRAGL